MSKQGEVVLQASRVGRSPPAIWAAFAKQSAWKNWVLVAQLFVIGLLVLANLRLAGQEPDVVLVSPDGKSEYLGRSTGMESLNRFLAEQRGQASDVTVGYFSKRFLTLALAVNSSTIEAAWAEALSLTAPPLRARLAEETKSQRVVEMYQTAQVRTDLAFEEVELVQRSGVLVHVRAKVRRAKSNLLDGSDVRVDRSESELVLKSVLRTPERPDGLEVVDWRFRQLSTVAGTAGEEKNDAK